MSQYLDSLPIGGTVKVKGPAGHVLYFGNGNFSVNAQPFHISKLSMVAGGTGITPMYQLIKAILRNPEDKTKMSLIFANKTVDDILLREELDQLAKQYPNNFKLWYTVDKPPKDQEWQYDVGFVNEVMLRNHIFPSGPDSAVFLCGPPIMIEYACFPNLEKMGYTEENIFEF
jgi:nitrate reductase (NAD(P)H)